MILENIFSLIEESSRLGRELKKAKNNPQKLNRMWGHLKGYAVEKEYVEPTFKSRKLIPYNRENIQKVQEKDFRNNVTSDGRVIDNNYYINRHNSSNSSDKKELDTQDRLFGPKFIEHRFRAHNKIINKLEPNSLKNKPISQLTSDEVQIRKWDVLDRKRTNEQIDRHSSPMHSYKEKDYDKYTNLDKNVSLFHHGGVNHINRVLNGTSKGYPLTFNGYTDKVASKGRQSLGLQFGSDKNIDISDNKSFAPKNLDVRNTFRDEPAQLKGTLPLHKLGGSMRDYDSSLDKNTGYSGVSDLSPKKIKLLDNLKLTKYKNSE